MSFAKSSAASFLAYKAFIDKRVLKYDLALVHGHIHSPYPIYVDVPIGEDASCYGRMMCTSDHPHCTTPKAAQSHIDVLEHGEYDGQPASKVLVRILTGKRHQIRLHMRYLGHPLIGDDIYTDPIDYQPHRMMLHARSLTIHTDSELIDALAKDPFSTQLDPKWKKTKTISPINRWSILSFHFKNNRVLFVHRFVNYHGRRILPRLILNELGNSSLDGVEGGT